MNNEIVKPVEFDGRRNSLDAIADHFACVGKMVRSYTGNHFVNVNKMVEHGFGRQRKIKRQSSHLWPSFPRRRESSGVKAQSSDLDGVEN